MNKRYLVLLVAVCALLTEATPQGVRDAHNAVVRVLIAKPHPLADVADLLDRAIARTVRGEQLADIGTLTFDQLVTVSQHDLYATIEVQGVILEDGESIVIANDIPESLGLNPLVGPATFPVGVFSREGELLASNGAPFADRNLKAIEVSWDRHLLLQRGQAEAAFLGFAPAEAHIRRIKSPLLLKVKGGLGVAGIPAVPWNVTRPSPWLPLDAYALTISSSEPILVRVAHERSLATTIHAIPGRLPIASAAGAGLLTVWTDYSAPVGLPRGSAIVDRAGKLRLVTMDDYVSSGPKPTFRGYGVCGEWLKLMSLHQVAFLKPSAKD